MTISLDPLGAEAWLARELGDIFNAKVSFTPEPNSQDSYHLSSGNQFWNSSDVKLLILRDTQNHPVEYHFTRVSTAGNLASIPIKSVSETLYVSIGRDAAGHPFVSRLLHSFGAALVIVNHELDIMLKPIGHDQLELDAWFDQDQDQAPSLGDLFKLLGYATTAEKDVRSDLAWLPEELRTGSIVEISSFHAMLEHESVGNEEPVALPGQRTGGTRIQNIAVNLSFLNDHAWQLIPGHDVLKAGKLTAHLQVNEPLNADYRFPRIDIGAAIIIKAESKSEAQIDLTARWPDYAVSGMLRQGDKLPLGELLIDFGVPAGKLPSGKDTLMIDELTLQAEPVFTPRSFSLSLGVNNVWKFPLGDDNQGQVKTLKINRISTYVDYQGRDTGNLSGRMFGQATIGNDEFLLSAEASNGGWAFSGSLLPRDDQQAVLKVGDWLDTLEKHLGVAKPALPQQITDFEISRIELALHSANYDLSFKLDCKTRLNNTDELDAELSLHYSKQSNKDYQLEVKGYIRAGYRQFDLVFDKNGKHNRLLAVYVNTHQDQLDIVDILTKLGGISLGKLTLPIALTSIEIAIDKAVASPVQPQPPSPQKNPPAKTTFLAGVDMGGSLDLAQLPLVGSVVNSAQAVAMSLQVLYSSNLDPNSDLTEAINTLLPGGSAPLPAAKEIAAGFNLVPTLQIGSDHHRLELPISISQHAQISEDNNNKGAGGVAPQNVDQAGGISWFSIQKQLGPAHLSRIGGQYKNSQLAFLIDASLKVGPLNFSMDGLSISTPLTEIEPSFALHGLGLEFSAGPLDIGGAFIHERIGDIDNYSGAAVLGFKALTLSAIGSYAEIHGQKSLFLYAILDYPLGGPAFFFVEGLAAGFGYNRAFVPPLISAVQNFPLIEEAKQGGGLPQDVSAEINKLQQFIPVRYDQYFLAAGIKFNSFKLIDSVAMLAVSFGLHFEVDVLGQSSLVLPTPDTGITPLAIIDMALKAVVNPEAGIISVEAALTPASHLFSEACRLTGGFAFCSWMAGEHNGDFVVTLGGYHPKFPLSKHKHYPNPPRVAFNWHYDDGIQIKGDMYCALTPVAVMAGGYLQATYHEGSIRAWFKMGADFLIEWKPYYYDAAIYIDVGGSLDVDLFLFSGTITIDVGADLHIWGPDFAGIATVHLYITSFDIHLGDSAPKRKKLDWETFEESFLPKNAKASVTIADGLVETDHVGIAVINSKHLRLITDTIIPAKYFEIKSQGKKQANNVKFSVAPMRNAASEFDTNHKISIKKFDADPKINAFVDDPKTDQSLIFIQRLKRLPKALWEDRSDFQDTSQPDITHETMLDSMLCGFEVTTKAPKKPKKRTQTKPIDKEVLLFNPDTKSVQWQKIMSSSSNALDNHSRRTDIESDILKSRTVSSRSQLMGEFGINPDNVDIRNATVESFRIPPVIEV